MDLKKDLVKACVAANQINGVLKSAEEQLKVCKLLSLEARTLLEIFASVTTQREASFCSRPIVVEETIKAKIACVRCHGK